MDNAFSVLLRASSVDDKAVGYGAQRTAQYEAYVTLGRARGQLRGYARGLLNRASPAGRVYGVLLLRTVDAEAAEEARRSLLSDTSPVQYFTGCVLEDTTVADLMERLHRGDALVTPSLGNGQTRALAETPPN